MKNFRERFEDMSEHELQGELSQFVWDDNHHQFLGLLDYLYHRGGGNDVHFDQALGKALAYACMAGAIECVAALINATPPLGVDIDSPCYKSLFPLHFAAQSGHPGVTELLLSHGARTDVRCNSSNIIDRSYYGCLGRKLYLSCYLPLHVALNQLWCSENIYEWDYFWKNRHCILLLLVSISLPFMQNLLETVRLLAWKTQETKEEFLLFARNGQVVEFAVLLLVARGKLLNSPDAVVELRRDLAPSSPLAYDKLVMLDLLDVFLRAGDEIEAYVKKDKPEITKLQVVSDVMCLLQQAGCHVNCDHNHDFERFGHEAKFGLTCSHDAKRLYTQKVSSSNYRWAVSKEPGHYKFKIPNISKILRESWIPTRSPTSHDLKFPASYCTSSKNGSDAKLKRRVNGRAINSPNILSSKPWNLYAAVIKRVARR